MKLVDTSSQVAFDTKSLNGLKAASKDPSPESIKEVAKQFEAVFMNMLLKSMRDATPQENQFDNEQSRTFTSMLDQQLSSNLSAKGLGLSDIIAKQLSKGINPVTNTMEQAVSDPKAPSASTTNAIINSPLAPVSGKTSMIQAYLAQLSNANPNTKLANVNSNPQTTAQSSIKNPYVEGMITSRHASTEFDDAYPQEVAINQAVNTNILGKSNFSKALIQHANVASASTGIPSKLMLGQAALETGWGQRQIKGQDGTDSYNLFGIKAGNSWTGKVVEALTTEYVNGVKYKRLEKFRAYDSYADSFKDFAKLMTNSPRYQEVLANLDSPAGYAKAMQKAGYATDPNYASKLANVIKRVAY